MRQHDMGAGTHRSRNIQNIFRSLTARFLAAGMRLQACRMVRKDERMRKAIDEWLADEGIEYFFVEDVGITSASFMENRL